MSGSLSNLCFYGGWGGFGEGLGLRTKMKENHHTPPHSSRGQQLTARYLRMIIGDDYEENYRPAWLFGMELDFYFPRLSLAIEFNGDQHHHYTAFGAPQEQQWRDWRKRKLCAAKGITIVSVKAIGLQYGSMRAKLKRAVGKKNLLPSRQGRAAQQELSRECAEYRKILIAKFNSPTARRSGCKPFKDAVAKSKELYRPPLS